MKRILLLTLVFSFSIVASPEHMISVTLSENLTGATLSVSLEPNQQAKLIYDMQKPILKPEHRELHWDCPISLIYNPEHFTIEGGEYEVSLKLLAVLNNNANLAYFINRTQPNPTSYTSWKYMEVATDSLQSLPIDLTDSVTLEVNVASSSS